ncbi:MAG: hypothetical protein ABI080_18105 [Candidatus Binatia bacterium]
MFVSRNRMRGFVAVLTAILVLDACGRADAATYTWNVGPWYDPNSWDPVGVPR